MPYVALLGMGRPRLLRLPLPAVWRQWPIAAVHEEAGSAYLPVTIGIAVAAGASARLFGRLGTRPVIVAGALLASATMAQRGEQHTTAV